MINEAVVKTEDQRLRSLGLTVDVYAEKVDFFYMLYLMSSGLIKRIQEEDIEPEEIKKTFGFMQFLKKLHDEMEG